MTDSPATVTVPVSALKTAANVSQTALKVTTGLAVFGSIFATIGPLLAMFFPSQAHTVAAVLSAASGQAPRCPGAQAQNLPWAYAKA